MGLLELGLGIFAVVEAEGNDAKNAEDTEDAKEPVGESSHIGAVDDGPALELDIFVVLLLKGNKSVGKGRELRLGEAHTLVGHIKDCVVVLEEGDTHDPKSMISVHVQGHDLEQALAVFALNVVLRGH